MQLSAYEIALIGGGFTIIGTILGAWITYRFALTLDRIRSKREAAAAFRAAFVDDQRIIRKAIDSGKGDQGFFLMYQRYISNDKRDELAIANEKAKIMFEPYLSATELEGFNIAWKNYIEWPRHFKCQYDDKEKTHEMLRHLEDLLKYAEPK